MMPAFHTTLTGVMKQAILDKDKSAALADGEGNCECLYRTTYSVSVTDHILMSYSMITDAHSQLALQVVKQAVADISIAGTALNFSKCVARKNKPASLSFRTSSKKCLQQLNLPNGVGKAGRNEGRPQEHAISSKSSICLQSTRLHGQL